MKFYDKFPETLHERGAFNYLQFTINNTTSAEKGEITRKCFLLLSIRTYFISKVFEKTVFLEIIKPDTLFSRYQDTQKRQRGLDP